MQRMNRLARVLLPTDEVIREYRHHTLLLDKLGDLRQDRGYTLEAIAEFIVSQWATCEIAPWRAKMESCPPIYEQVMMYLYTDFLIDEWVRPLGPEDATALQHIVTQFANEIYETVIPMLTDFNLSEYQLQTMATDRWVGSSMVLAIVEH